MSTLLDCGLLSTTRVAQPVISFDQAKAIAEVHGTPALVLSCSVLQRNYEAMRSEMPGVELFYAAKANPEFLVLKNLRDRCMNLPAGESDAQEWLRRLLETKHL